MESDDARSSGVGGLSPHAPGGSVTRPSEDLAQREARRLASMRDVDTVKAAALDGLEALNRAERDLDFQAYVAGLRKLLAAGLLAKDVADTLEQRYGSDAVSL